jgi:hypothetical protein
VNVTLGCNAFLVGAREVRGFWSGAEPRGGSGVGCGCRVRLTLTPLGGALCGASVDVPAGVPA